MYSYIIIYMKYLKGKKEKIILIIILLLLVVINYGFIDSFLQNKISGNDAVTIKVDRVIDGDTVVVNGTSMRLLGINSPEKNQKYYNDAKKYLESLVMNKTIIMKSKGKDKYYRELVYLYDIDGKKTINLKMVEEGYANFYFPSGKDEHYKDFVKSWRKCLAYERNLCEFSNEKCASCIELQEWGYNKDVILYNKCKITCDLSDWSIKDQGRKLLVFEELILGPEEGVQITPEAFGVEYVWTKSGDSIFIRDRSNMLVIYENY